MRKFFGNKESKTFRPQKSHAPGTKRWHLHSHAAELLREGSGADAVKLPPGEDLNEWLAVHSSLLSLSLDAMAPAVQAGS